MLAPLFLVSTSWNDALYPQKRNINSAYQSRNSGFEWLQYTEGGEKTNHDCPSSWCSSCCSILPCIKPKLILSNYGRRPSFNRFKGQIKPLAEETRYHWQTKTEAHCCIPSGWAIFWKAVGAIIIGIDILKPKTVVAMSILLTSIRIRGRNLCIIQTKGNTLLNISMHKIYLSYEAKRIPTTIKFHIQRRL